MAAGSTTPVCGGTTTCATTADTIIISAQLTTTDQTYTIGDVSDSYQIDEMTEDSTYCDSSDIIYSHTVTT
jgi:hypothetical protein